MCLLFWAIFFYLVLSQNILFQSLLTDSSNREVWPQLLDIYGSCRNARAHQAAVSSVGNPTKTSRPDLCERYLWSAAQVANPSVTAVKELAKILANSEIEDEKLSESLVLALGTLSRKTSNAKVTSGLHILRYIFAAVADFLSISQLSGSILQLIVGGLQSCKTQSCILVHLRALRNTQNPKVASILLQMAKLPPSTQADKKISSTAIKGLASLPIHDVFKAIGK